MVSRDPQQEEEMTQDFPLPLPTECPPTLEHLKVHINSAIDSLMSFRPEDIDQAKHDLYIALDIITDIEDA